MGMVAEPLIDLPARTGSAGEFCPLCGGRGEFWGTREGYKLRECRDGHPPLLLSWPWASAAEYRAFYAPGGGFHTSHQEEIGLTPFEQRDGEYLIAASVRLRFLTALYPHARRVLDIGAGTGAWVGLLQAHGYEVEGWELNADLTAWALGRGRAMRAGDWRAAVGAAERPDLVSLHDVLEHLTDPRECLEAFRGIMAPGSGLIVEMPEYQAPNPGWVRHIRPLEHLCLYSRSAAEALFEECGFVVDAYARPKRGALGKMVHYLALR